MKPGLVAIISIVAMCGFGSAAFGKVSAAAQTREATPTPSRKATPTPSRKVTPTPSRKATRPTPSRKATATASKKPTATPTPGTKLYVTNVCDSKITAYLATSNGNVPPLSPGAGLENPAGIAFDASGKIYVANACGSITVYAHGSSGDAKPIATIAGPHTGLIEPQGIAVDSKGKIYVSNFVGWVTVYAPGSNGDAKPIATITGPDNGYQGIAVDSNGKIYVTNPRNFNVTVYAAGSNGNANPVAYIAGPQTGLDSPQGVSVDSKGKIYVANQGSSNKMADSVTVYAAGSNGDAKPVATIIGPDSGLLNPQGIAVDSKGTIYVTNAGTPNNPKVRVTEYTAGSNGDAEPIATIGGPDTGLDLPSAIEVDSTGTIYVANPGSSMGGDGHDSLTEYAAGSNGNAEPVATIGGPDTGLDAPQGVAVDSRGKIYVANGGYYQEKADRVTVYAAESNGDAKPVATIAGPQTGLYSPVGIAVDSRGKIYVADSYGLTVYAAGSNGNVKPVATIAGTNTGLYYPVGIAVDSEGKIFVANSGSSVRQGCVTVYAAGSNGDAKPVATIAGPHTGLAEPQGIAVDSRGKIYVTDRYSGVLVYAAGSNGDIMPLATIIGPDTGPGLPQGIAVDSNGKIYVTEYPGADYYGAMTVYAAGSNGDAKPVATISGWKTGLREPIGIAIEP